jgi:hypothetical protein
MTRRMAEAGVSWAERRLSRRGFIALMGKVGLAIAAATGVSQWPRPASAACDCTPGCGGCPPSPLPHACPANCTGVSSAKCCDDSMGPPGVCYECHECLCLTGTCYCMYNLGYVCDNGEC